jgi:hypothetical protein
MPVLGTVVGHDPDKIRGWVKGRTDLWRSALPLLQRQELPLQLALLIARWCMVAKPNSLARSLPPEFTPPLAEHDEAVIRALEQRLQLSFSEFSRGALQLPISMGGVGFCPSAEAAPHAFAAGMASSLALLPYTNLKELGGERAIGLPRFQALAKILHDYSSSPLDFADKCFFKDLPGFIMHFASQKHSKKLQSRIMATIRSDRAAKLREMATPEQRALLKSRANKDSALVWKAYPLTRELRLEEDEARFLVVYATGSTLPGLPQVCACGVKLTSEHLVHCAEKLTRHNNLQGRLVSFAREQGVTVKTNPRLSFEHAKQYIEPDIILYRGIAKPLQADVTVVNPCCPSKLESTLKTRGCSWAIRNANSRKRLKYDERARLLGHDFTPVALETHGAMGKEVHTVLRTLAANTRGVDGLAAKNMALDLAVTLARGNARCATKTIANAQRHQDLLRTGK